MTVTLRVYAGSADPQALPAYYVGADVPLYLDARDALTGELLSSAAGPSGVIRYPVRPDGTIPTEALSWVVVAPGRWACTVAVPVGGPYLVHAAIAAPTTADAETEILVYASAPGATVPGAVTPWAAIEELASETAASYLHSTLPAELEARVPELVNGAAGDAVTEAVATAVPAAIAARLDVPRGAGTALMGGVDPTASGNAAKMPVWRNPSPTDLIARRVPTNFRYLSDMVRDAGEALENEISHIATESSGGPLDHYAAFNRHVVAGRRRVLFNRPSYYFRTALGSGVRNMVLVAGASSGGQPTVIFENELGHMIALASGCDNVRFEGHWIIAFRDTPPSASYFGLNCTGCKNIQFDRLTILNTLAGCRFVTGTSNVRIGQLDLPAGVGFSTDGTISNVVIERMTGGSTSGIGANDVEIGAQLPAILSNIGLLTASANKLLRFDGSGAAALDDWIEGASWTPTMTAATPGDLDTSGLSVSGTYSKQGRSLTLNYVLTGTISYSTASGALRIGGAPFLFSGDTAQSMDIPSTIPAWTWPGAAPTLFAARAVGSQSYFEFVGGQSGASLSIAQIGMWPSGSNFTLRGRIRARSLI